MPVPNPIVLILLNHEVIADLAPDRLLECSKDCATVILASLRANQALRVDIEGSSSVELRPFNHLDFDALCLCYLFLRYDYCSQRQLCHPIYVSLRNKFKKELLGGLMRHLHRSNRSNLDRHPSTILYHSQSTLKEQCSFSTQQNIYTGHRDKNC